MVRSKERRGFLQNTWGVVSILVFFVSLSQAVLIDDMQIDVLPTAWYDGSTQQFKFEFDGIPGFPAMYTFGQISDISSGSYDYFFQNGNIAITNADLIDDATSENGGLAKGIFEGGGTLTITGTLQSFITGEIITSGTILVAQMSSASWYLEELQSPPNPANKIRGSAFYTTVGGALYNGNNSAGLQLCNFRVDFTFPDVVPATTNFGNTSYSSSNPQLQIVPEPASLAVFGLSTLMVIIKRNRK